MRAALVPVFALIMALLIARSEAGEPEREPLPQPAPGWSIELAAQRPEFAIRHPSSWQSTARSTSARPRRRRTARRASAAVRSWPSKMARAGSSPTDWAPSAAWNGSTARSMSFIRPTSLRSGTTTATAGPTSGSSWSPAWARRPLPPRESTTTSPLAFERAWTAIFTWPWAIRGFPGLSAKTGGASSLRAEA